MFTLPDQSSVIYRTGFSDRDYDEAIEALKDAKAQQGQKHKGCSICWDSSHVANQCHHNPLTMARRAIKAVRVWRCFHCDEVFTDSEKAAFHFGQREKARPICVI